VNETSKDSVRAEGLRAVKAVALGLALGLALARWASGATRV
jgi:hypothetical protein